MRVVRSHTLHLFILFSIIIACTGDDASDCIYGIYVKTGSVRKAGTHSVISLTLWDASGAHIEIPNIEDWGLMGPGFNYFETGELNIFGVKGSCLNGPICGLNVTSDGSGPYHGWYCAYVEVTSIGLQKQCSGQHFTVEQWLDKNTFPYQLTAIKDLCRTAGSKLGLDLDSTVVLSG